MLDDVLIFSQIRVNSPGLWEVIGKWAPLETIRKALNDAHERKKDDSYRSTEEAKELRLKNSILEARVMQEWIKTLRAAGATDEEIEKIMAERIVAPLLKLEKVALPALHQGEAAAITEEK